MTMTQLPAEALAARRARHLRELGDLDYKRNIVLLKVGGTSQSAIARMLDITQPTVQKLLRRAERLPMPRDGFSGADPYEICERYAVGFLDRAQLVDELSRWSYSPRAHVSSELDDVVVDEPGSIADLERALDAGLIDDELFDEIADCVEARGTQE